MDSTQHTQKDGKLFVFCFMQKRVERERACCIVFYLTHDWLFFLKNDTLQTVLFLSCNLFLEDKEKSKCWRGVFCLMQMIEREIERVERCRIVVMTLF
mmetsp:Transcript_17070/g.25333  ORF Transcript_17070/g.25333 Transcript_17070/m.25333 type:complete len:98 (+) Transcript_17070:125-418(+)